LITNTGKTILAKYLIGSAPAYASHLALGVGPKPLGTSDTLGDYSGQTSLAFEALRIPITSRGYLYDEAGAANIVFFRRAFLEIRNTTLQKLECILENLTHRLALEKAEQFTHLQNQRAGSTTQVAPSLLWG